MAFNAIADTATQLWTITRSTYIAALRQPVYAALLIGTSLILAVTPMFTTFTMGEENKLLVDMGLSMILLSGLILVGFSAAGVLAREIEDRTVLTVVSKPVPRAVYLLGKYLGLSWALLLACWSWILIFLLTVRHGVMIAVTTPYDQPVLVFGLGAAVLAFLLALAGNYFYGWVFPSTLARLLATGLTLAYVLVLFIGKDWQVQSPGTDIDLQVWAALLLVVEGLLVLAAIAIAAATRLGQVQTLIVCSIAFLIGLAADALMTGAAAAQSAALKVLAQIAFFLAPNIQVLWLADALSQERPVDGGYIILVSAYAGLYITAMLALAVALFQTRETG